MRANLFFKFGKWFKVLKPIVKMGLTAKACLAKQGPYAYG